MIAKLGSGSERVGGGVATAREGPTPRSPAPRRSTYGRNFGLNFVGNIGYAATQYALLVILARLGSPEMVGQYSLALALAAPVFMFTNARLAALLATDAGRVHGFDEYLSARLLATALGSAAVLAAGAATGYRGPVLVTLALVTAAKAIESVSDVCYGYLALREAFAWQTASLLVRGLGAVAAAAVAAVFTHNLMWIAGCIAGVWLAALILLDLPGLARLAASDPVPDRAPSGQGSSARRRIHIDRRTWHLLWAATPLGFVALAASLSVSLPRVVIERELGARSLGYFSALAYLVVGGRMVAIALGSAAAPRLGRYYVARDRAAFIRTLVGLVSFGASLGAVGVLLAVTLGGPMLRLLYGGDYARFAPLLVWLMTAAGLGYVSTYLQDSLTTARNLVPKAVLLAGVATSSGLLAAWLVPRDGLQGAAVAVCAAGAVEVIGSALLVWAVLRKFNAPPLDARARTALSSNA